MCKKLCVFVVVPALCLLTYVPNASAQEASNVFEVRTWTAGGFELEAEFVRFDEKEGMVYLETKNGQKKKIRLLDLSEEDQAFVDKAKWAARVVNPFIDADDPVPAGPVFEVSEVVDSGVLRLRRLAEGYEFLEEAETELSFGSRAFGKDVDNVDMTVVESNLAKALKCFESALKLQPDSEQTHLAVADAYMRQIYADMACEPGPGEEDEKTREEKLDAMRKRIRKAVAGAIQHLDEAIRLDPNYVAAYCYRAALYCRISDFHDPKEIGISDNCKEKAQADVKKILSLLKTWKPEITIFGKKYSDDETCYLILLEKGLESMGTMTAVFQIRQHGLWKEDTLEEVRALLPLLFENAQWHFKRALAYKADSARANFLLGELSFRYSFIAEVMDIEIARKEMKEILLQGTRCLNEATRLNPDYLVAHCLRSVMFGEIDSLVLIGMGLERFKKETLIFKRLVEARGKTFEFLAEEHLEKMFEYLEKEFPDLEKWFDELDDDDDD